MSKKTNETNQTKKPTLTKPRKEVSDFLLKRIEIGQVILHKEIKSKVDLDNVYREKDKWHKFNLEYLRHCFDIDSIAEEYDFAGATSLYVNPPFTLEVDSLKSSIERCIDELESINERLSIFQERLNQEFSEGEQFSSDPSMVFIVHGHDEALKHKVARLVNRLGLKEIILDEQPNQGMTIIEKFEQHAQIARYAIILLTHDDMGYPKNSPNDVKPRARQNAIAELGYFLRALGRKYIAILSSDEIEIPSDFQGVLYLSVKGDEWELRLAKEMKAAGLEVDMNKLIQV